MHLDLHDDNIMIENINCSINLYNSYAILLNLMALYLILYYTARIAHHTVSFI